MRTWIKSSSLLVLKTIKRKRPWTVFYESLKFKVLFGRKKGHCLSIVFVWMKNQKDNKQLEACLLTEPWKVAWSSGGGVAALPYSDWYWLFLAYTIRQDRFARTAVGGWVLHFIFTWFIPQNWFRNHSYQNITGCYQVIRFLLIE